MLIIIDYEDFRKEVSCSVRPDGEFVLHYDSDIPTEDQIGTAIYDYLCRRFEEINLDTDVYSEWLNGKRYRHI